MAESGMFLIHGDGHLVEMREQPYDSEALLQRLLADYPTILAGDQIDSAAPRRWRLVSREVSVPSEERGAGRWSLDHLLLDQDGIPTLVEVKRSSDTRLRREVVGQLLDYAANAISYWPPESIRAQFEAHCMVKGLITEEDLAEFLGTADDHEAFWQRVTENLRTGRIRLIFVADCIPPELLRIIEFLNNQMNPAEVLGVEVRQFIGEGLTTLVPRILGQTVETQQRKTSVPRAARTWDETTFLEDLERRNGMSAVQTTKRLIDWANGEGLQLAWGQGATHGSFTPLLSYKGQQYSFSTVWPYGKVQVGFGNLMKKPPFDAESLRLDLLQRLNQLPGVELTPNAIDRYPAIPLSIIESDAPFTQFIQILGWIINQIKIT